METVNNLATAASKAIWGEGKGTDEAQKDSTTAASSNTTAGTEPVAGQTGNVEAGEPYDKGNVEGEFSFSTYYMAFEASFSYETAMDHWSHCT